MTCTLFFLKNKHVHPPETLAVTATASVSNFAALNAATKPFPIYIFFESELPLFKCSAHHPNLTIESSRVVNAATALLQLTSAASELRRRQNSALSLIQKKLKHRKTQLPQPSAADL
jgi:hypothetical protein